MDNAYASRVSKHIRLSLPNASGVLTMVTAAVSGAGGIVGEVHCLHENTRRRMVELDIITASKEQWAAIIHALTGLARVRIEGEADPALEAHRGGLIDVQPTVPFRSEEDFTTFYTSGAVSVAQTITHASHLARRSSTMSHDDEWLTTLLRRWTVLTPEVRSQLQDYLHLSPGDRKNQRRLEKTLKVAAGRRETFHHEVAGRKAQS